MPISTPPSGAPAGAIAYMAANAVPTGWIKANGAAINRTTYAALFLVIGTTYGAGNGSTTFALPDLRGEFLRSLDDGRGIDTGRGIGAAQGHAIQNITGAFDLPSNTGQFSAGATGIFGQIAGGGGTVISGVHPSAANRITFDASGQAQTASESRPRNIAMLACIKY